MKVLFLDIDGVCNSHKTWALYGHSTPVAKNCDYRLDPTVLRFLELLHKNGVQIVLSSTWRLGVTVEEAKDFINVPVLDLTCSYPFPESVRGDEIACWLKDHEVEAYCIVDDDSDMLPEQLPFFVKTLYGDGLQYQGMLRVCEILGLELHQLLKESEKDPGFSEKFFKKCKEMGIPPVN